jgi:hypothetical protein
MMRVLRRSAILGIVARQDDTTVLSSSRRIGRGKAFFREQQLAEWDVGVERRSMRDVFGEDAYQTWSRCGIWDLGSKQCSLQATPSVMRNPQSVAGWTIDRLPTAVNRCLLFVFCKRTWNCACLYWQPSGHFASGNAADG